jgi:hypothetical protein
MCAYRNGSLRIQCGYAADHMTPILRRRILQEPARFCERRGGSDANDA